MSDARQGTIRVVLADDHPLFRRGLGMALSTVGGFSVVSEAADGESAIAAAAQLRPDVVVMDINMPGLNGIEATRRIASVTPAPGVLMLTMFEDDDSVFAAMRAGARGYVVKGGAEEEIVQAVKAVARGEAIFGAPVALRMLRYFANVGAKGPSSPFPDLTERELEVLELIAAGHSNPVIAQRLFLSPKTVRNHVSNILTKLQVASRAEAIVRARRAGLGDQPPAASP